MAKTKSNIEFRRININIPLNLIERVKEYADNLGINITSAYIVLLNQALDQKDTMNYLPLFKTIYEETKKGEDNK